MIQLLAIPVVLGVAYVTKKAMDEIKASKGQLKTSDTAPVQGMPSSGPGAPIGITGPGVPQPDDRVIALPPQTVVPQDVHDTSATLIQNYATSGPPPPNTPEVAAFQAAYNATNPGIPLAVDGNYGAKTQAVLQSVITPALAPSQSILKMVIAPATQQPVMKKIAVVSPKLLLSIIPNMTVAQDIQKATNALMDFLSKGGLKKGSFKEVTTFQTAWNGHHKNQPLVADGIYGASCQSALQSALNYLKDNRKAPRSPYAPVGMVIMPTKIPVFIP